MPIVLFNIAFIVEEIKNAVAEPKTTYHELPNVLFKDLFICSLLKL